MFITTLYLIACSLLAYLDGTGQLPPVLFICQYFFAVMSLVYFVIGRKKLGEVLVPFLLVLTVSFGIEYLGLVSRKLETLGEFHSEAFAVYFFMTFVPSIIVYFVAFGIGAVIRR